jgi:predicted CXXCH cytochrome family protein
MKTPFLVSRCWSLLLAGIIALMLAFPHGQALAQDEPGDDEDESSEVIELDEEDLACLECHDDPTLEAKLESGETLSLHISTEAFLGSMHNENSCADCHYEIDIDDHGQGQSTITSKRELGVSMAEACVDCHKKSYRQYNDSVHGLLFEQGHEKAPACADCHNPHTVTSWKLAEAEAAMPCGKCHEDIFKASAKDVHGLAQADKDTKAPVCSGCHQAHGVKAASLGSGIRDTCLDCHEDAADKHKVWLPNSERHFEAISCPVCHAPTAERRVNLRLYEGTGKDQKQMLEKTGVPQFVKSVKAADPDGVGLGDRELLSLLKEFTEEAGETKTVVRGRLEVSSGVQAHQLAEKSEAISDCKLCHQSGAEPFQTVVLSMAGPDGRPLRHEVRSEVLNSLFSIDAVKGFYVLGSTRIKLFDYLLLLVVVGMAAGLLVHIVARWLFRRAREKGEARLRRERDGP